MDRFSFAWLFAIPLLLIGAWFGWFFLDIYAIHRRIPDRYLIPNGYVGHVEIEFAVSDAPKLRVVDRHRIFPISGDGTLRTSSRYEDSYPRRGYGWAHDEYFYVDGDRLTPLNDCAWCERETVWSTMFSYPNASGPPPRNFAGSETYFVGTKSDFCRLDKEKVYNICK